MFSIFGLCVAVSLLCGLTEQSSCADYRFTPVTPLLPINLVGTWLLHSTRDDGLPYHGYNCIKFEHVFRIGRVGQLKTTENAKNPSTNAYETSISTMTFGALNGAYTYSIGDISQKTDIIFTDYTTYYVEASCDDTNGVYIGIFVRKPAFNFVNLNGVLDLLDKRYKIKRDTLRIVDQTNCA